MGSDRRGLVQESERSRERRKQRMRLAQITGVLPSAARPRSGRRRSAAGANSRLRMPARRHWWACCGVCTPRAGIWHSVIEPEAGQSSLGRSFTACRVPNWGCS